MNSGPLYVGGTRIFTPQEVLTLYAHAQTNVTRHTLLYYISTGIRYTEGDFILDNPGSFDYQNRVIHFKSNKMWSRERLWKDRDIYLSYFDVMNVFNFIREVRPRKFTTKSQVLKHNLKRWANELGMQPGGIGSKSTRKTRFVWLLKAYPEYEDLIIKTMDYNPTKNAMIDMSDDDIDHYKRVQLDDKTIRIIKSLLYGWNTSIE